MDESGSNDSYDDLIEGSIDGLNEGGDFAGTKIDSAKERKVTRKSVLESPIVVFLGILAVLSSAWLVYERQIAAPEAISIGEANTQLQTSINDTANPSQRKAASAFLSAASASPEEAKKSVDLNALSKTLADSGVDPQHSEELKAVISSAPKTKP